MFRPVYTSCGWALGARRALLSTWAKSRGAACRQVNNAELWHTHGAYRSMCFAPQVGAPHREGAVLRAGDAKGERSPPQPASG